MHVPEKAKVKDKTLRLNEGAKHPTKQNKVAKLIQNVYRLVGTRSERVVYQPQRLINSIITIVCLAVYVCAVTGRLLDGTINEPTSLYAQSASITDNDTMYLQEAMNQPDKEKFLEAMIKEIEDHNQRGHWCITM